MREGIVIITSKMVLNNPRRLKKEARPKSTQVLRAAAARDLLAPLQSCQSPDWSGYTVSCITKPDPGSINFSFASFSDTRAAPPLTSSQAAGLYPTAGAAQVGEQAEEAASARAAGEKALPTAVSGLIPPVYLGKEKV